MEAEEYIQDIDGLLEKGKTGEQLKKDLIKTISKGRGEALGMDANKTNEREAIMR